MCSARVRAYAYDAYSGPMSTDYTCPVCSERFDSRTQLKSHAFKEHDMYVSAGRGARDVGPPRFECPECGEMFHSRGELFKHQRAIREAAEASRRREDRWMQRLQEQSRAEAAAYEAQVAAAMAARQQQSQADYPQGADESDDMTKAALKQAGFIALCVAGWMLHSRLTKKK